MIHAFKLRFLYFDISGESHWRILNDTKKARIFLSEDPGHKPGNNLLSHRIGAALPSATAGLTSVFEMGTCISPRLWSPDV
mgnify:CR=1 FL=1